MDMEVTDSRAKHRKIEWVYPVYVDGPLKGGSCRVRKDRLSDGVTYRPPRSKNLCHYYLHPVGIGKMLLTIGSVHADGDKISLDDVYMMLLNDMAKAAITGTRELPLGKR